MGEKGGRKGVLAKMMSVFLCQYFIYLTRREDEERGGHTVLMWGDENKYGIFVGRTKKSRKNCPVFDFSIFAVFDFRAFRTFARFTSIIFIFVVFKLELNFIQNFSSRSNSTSKKSILELDKKMNKIC